jgi:hypothetical protein
MRLSISLATRGRPDLLIPTLRTTLANMELESTRLVVCIDEGDDVKRDYDFDYLGDLPDDNRLIYSVLPQEDSLGEKYNRVLRLAPADVYLVMVDYAPYVTPGFDRKILQAAEIFPDDIGIIYNDLANINFPQMNAVTGRLAQLMGGIYPPWFPYWFVDHWLDDIGRMIGRITYVDAKVDTTRRPGTRNLREPAFWATLYDALKPERRAIAGYVLDRLWGSKSHKDMLRSAWPLIEQRSDRINDLVRAQGNIMGVPSDARYRRIKERAVVKLHESLDRLEAA